MSRKPLDERLKEAELAKLRLERRELITRIRSHDTPAAKWARLAVAIAVPLITALIALTAAYIELRKTRDERTALDNDKRTYLALQEQSFTQQKVTAAVTRLESSSTASEIKATLAALRDLLLSSDQPDERAIRVAVSYIASQSEDIRTTAEALLLNSSSSSVGRLLLERVQQANGSSRLHLLHVMSQLSEKNGAEHLSSLLGHKDLLVAGVASYALGGKVKDKTKLAQHFKDLEPETKDRERLLETILLSPDKASVSVGLKPFLEELNADRAIDIGSPEGRGIYYLMQEGLGDNFLPFGEEILASKSVPVENKLLATVFLRGRSESRRPAEKFARDTLRSPQNLATLPADLVGVVAKQHGIPVPKLEFGSIEALLKQGGEKRENLIDYLKFGSVTLEVLRQWSREAGREHLLFRRGARDEMFRRDEASSLTFFRGELGLKEEEVALYLAKSKDPRRQEEAEAVARKLIAGKEGPFWEHQAVSIIRELAKRRDVASLVVAFHDASAFEFYAQAEDVAPFARDTLYNIMRRDVENGTLSPPQAAFFAIEANLAARFKDIAQLAFDKSLENWKDLERARFINNPEYFADEINQSILFLNLLVDHPSFKQMQAKLKEQAFKLPLVPQDELGGLMIGFEKGSIGMGAVPVEALFARFLPGYLDRLRRSVPDDASYMPGTTDLSYHVLVADVLLGLSSDARQTME